MSERWLYALSTSKAIFRAGTVFILIQPGDDDVGNKKEKEK